MLLPRPDGTVGALTDTHVGQQQVLDAPYATARVRQQGTLEDGGRLTAAEVEQRFQPALGAQPPRPVTFVLYFQDDSDEFTPVSKLEIPKITAEITGHPAPEIVVVGHTDRDRCGPWGREHDDVREPRVVQTHGPERQDGSTRAGLPGHRGPE